MMVISKDLKDLAPRFPLKNILFSEDLKKHLHIKIGGKADYLIFPGTYDELRDVISFFDNFNIPITIIGKGTNLIVKDGGIRGAVISLKYFNKINVIGNFVYAGAGASLIKTCKVAMDYSLTGLEFASGIPGSVGGAVFMNAGAYGGEIAQVLTMVYLYRPGEGFYHRSRKELSFGYRQSRLQKEGQIVLEGLFELRRGEEGNIREKMSEFNRRRKEKQPLEFPNAGSIFKRPPGAFVGRLITEAGLKGVRIGDAQVAEKHAGFIVNRGRATARDVLALIGRIKEEVRKKSGILLETEIRVVGEE